MSTKPVLPRETALQDGVDHYLDEATAQVALDFIDSLEAAYGHIARAPKTGSARFGHALNLPGLRSWPLSRFPFLVFYFEHDDRIDIWRVLHMSRDVPAWIQGD
jgi:toxin ParE1/3/4